MRASVKISCGKYNFAAGFFLKKTSRHEIEGLLYENHHKKCPEKATIANKFRSNRVASNAN